MSIVCWSCATLRFREEKLMEKISEIVLPCLNELKPFELSNMLWAYAKLSMGNPPLLAAVSERMLSRQQGEFSMQCLSMIAWSFATEKQRDASVFYSIANEIVNHACAKKPQEIANTLWAYAKNRCTEVRLFEELASAAISSGMLWSFKPQELSNTVWAFATVSLQHPALFKQVVAVAISKRRELSPQNIANILWAYAKLQVWSHSGLFPALLSVSVKMMPQHKPHEISAIVWAAAKENYPACQRFFGATAHMCAARLHEFPPQALANMVEAFAVIEADSPSFSEAMARESVGRLHQFEPMALSNLFRGIALSTRRARDMGAPTSERQLQVLGTIGTHIASRMSEMQPSDLGHVEHSLQLLGPGMRESVGGNLNQTMRSQNHVHNREAAEAADRGTGDLDGAGPEGGLPSITGFDAFEDVFDKFAKNKNRSSGQWGRKDEDDFGIDESLWAKEGDGSLPPSVLLGDIAHDIEALGDEEQQEQAWNAGTIMDDFAADIHDPYIRDALKEFQVDSEWKDSLESLVSKGGGWSSKGYGSSAGKSSKGKGLNIVKEDTYDWRDHSESWNVPSGKGHAASSKPAWSGPGSRGFQVGRGRNTKRQDRFSDRASPQQLGRLQPMGAGDAGLWGQPVGPPPGIDTSWGGVGNSYQGHNVLPWNGASPWDPWTVPVPSQGVAPSAQGSWQQDRSWYDGQGSLLHAVANYGLNPMSAAGPLQATEETDGTIPVPFAGAPPSLPAVAYDSSAARAGTTMWQPRKFDASCLVQLLKKPNKDTTRPQQWQVVDLGEYLHVAVIGASTEVVRLKCGVLDMRVVVKRMSLGNASWPDTISSNSHLLPPCGIITTPENEGDCYACYPYCHQSSLGEKILAGFSSGKPTSPKEAARLVHGVLEAATTLIASGVSTTCLRADEIFVDELGEAKVRLRHDADPSGSEVSGAAAKWFAPEEPEVSQLASAAPAWPAAAFRIGLLLYCIGAQTPDPFPHKRGDLVLLDLHREVTGAGKPVRPNMFQYQHPENLRTLMEECLRSQASQRPDQFEISQRLRAAMSE